MVDGLIIIPERRFPQANLILPVINFPPRTSAQTAVLSESLLKVEVQCSQWRMLTLFPLERPRVLSGSSPSANLQVAECGFALLSRLPSPFVFQIYDFQI
jgi:hypothetical protein